MTTIKDFSEIRAISFDADGTLFDFEKVMRQSLDITLKEMEKFDKQVAARLDVDKMIEIRNTVAAELKDSSPTHEEVRLAAFKRTLAEAGRPDDSLATHLNDVFFQHRFTDIELFDDVRTTLDNLRMKYKLGLLSNGNSYPERCGLPGVFHFVVFSTDFGIEKPDPRLFHIVSGKSGFPTYRILHIGDSLKNDVAGSKAVGMKSIWLNRTQQKPDPGISFEHEIHSLTELLDIL